MLQIDLTGKKAFITGGSRGVGKAICLTLADCGADVAFTYLSRDEAAMEVVREIENMGRKALCYKCDVGNFEQMKEVLSRVKNKFSKLDIIINNAGGSKVFEIDELTPEYLDSVLKSNLYGSFYSIMAGGLDLLREAGGGSIINIGSSAMYSGMGGGPQYSSAKAGLMGLTRYMAVQYGSENIRCNTLAISLIKTEQLNKFDEKMTKKKIATVPVGRLGTPEDVAYMAAFLSSDMATYVSGEIILMDGARTYAK